MDPRSGSCGCCSEVVVADSDEVATLTSGDLTVRVAKGDAWSVDFVAHEVAGDRVLTNSGWRGLGIVDVSRELLQSDAPTALTALEGYTSDRYIKDELALGVGEVVYGLGEQFTAFCQRTGRSSISGTPTAAPRASRPTRTSPSI